MRQVVRLRTLYPVIARCRYDAIAARKYIPQHLFFIKLRFNYDSRRLHVLKLQRRSRDHHRLYTDLLGSGRDSLAVGTAALSGVVFRFLTSLKVNFLGA